MKPNAMLVCLLLWAAIAFVSPSVIRGQADRHVTEPPFPLIAGSHWIHEGTVRWASPGSSDVREDKIRWKMEVLETLDRQSVVAARVKGHPMDLAFYEDGRKPGEYLIVQVWGDRYYLLQGNRVSEVLARLRAEPAATTHLVRESELFLELPLVEGRSFGEAEHLTRLDRFYVWVVEKFEQAALHEVRGVPSQPVQVWTVSHRSIGGMQRYEFAAGIGLTRFQYRHQGTVSEFDLRLVEYHKP